LIGIELRSFNWSGNISGGGFERMSKQPGSQRKTATLVNLKTGDVKEGAKGVLLVLAHGAVAVGKLLAVAMILMSVALLVHGWPSGSLLIVIPFVLRRKG